MSQMLPKFRAEQCGVLIDEWRRVGFKVTMPTSFYGAAEDSSNVENVDFRFGSSSNLNKEEN